SQALSYLSRVVQGEDLRLEARLARHATYGLAVPAGHDGVPTSGPGLLDGGSTHEAVGSVDQEPPHGGVAGGRHARAVHDPTRRPRRSVSPARPNRASNVGGATLLKASTSNPSISAASAPASRYIPSLPLCPT